MRSIPSSSYPSSLVLFLAWFIPLTLGAAEPSSPATRPILRLTTPSAQLDMDLAGGSLASFTIPTSPINPLSWNAPRSNQNHAYGHFLCLDRWGPPSEAEARSGMPYHGEATHVSWSVLQSPQATAPSQVIRAITETTLPKAGLHVQRTLLLSPTSPVALIEEKVTNRNPLGRMLNIVQHPTIAPPFLTAETVVDCNGTRGFAQGASLPTPEEPSFPWPFAKTTSNIAVDLRRLTSSPEPNVTSFIIEKDLGWVTASSPRQRLLLGYIWLTRDYPWVSHWRDVQKGQPAARGLEFGSTGLHQPFPILARKPFIWDRPTYEYLDASASLTKRYLMFLVPIPESFQGVETISLQGETLSIHERGARDAQRAFQTLLIPGLKLP